MVLRLNGQLQQAFGTLTVCSTCSSCSMTGSSTGSRLVLAHFAIQTGLNQAYFEHDQRLLIAYWIGTSLK